MLKAPFCGVLLAQRITACVMVAPVCFEIVGIFYYCNEGVSPFPYFFQDSFFQYGALGFQRHFNLACTISYGCINNPSESTAFLRNLLKQEPIADHFKLIHPAVGRKNCDSRAFLSTISFFHRC